MTESANEITVRVVGTRKAKAFDVAVYNCKWMGGKYDPVTQTWAIPADRADDVDRFVAGRQIEIVEPAV